MKSALKTPSRSSLAQDDQVSCKSDERLDDRFKPQLPSAAFEPSGALATQGDLKVATEGAQLANGLRPRGTEIVTRIIKTQHPGQEAKSQTVLEQELQSHDPKVMGGCRISSRIVFDVPPPRKAAKSRGVIIKELNEDGSSKHGSVDELHKRDGHVADHVASQGSSDSIDAAGTTAAPPGEIFSETRFQKVKSGRDGATGREESWKYSMECNYVNGSNTTVR